MSKTIIIVAANAGIFVLYASGMGVSFWLGMTPDDFIKLVPTASASAIANMTILTFALITILKGTANFEIGAPEQDNWTVIVPLTVNCQGSCGVRLERIDAEWLDYSKLFEGSGRNEAKLPVEIETGKIKELYVQFDVLKNKQAEILKQRKLLITCYHFVEGKQTSSVKYKKCLNVFRRR
jgi:hypothetical protein